MRHQEGELTLPASSAAAGDTLYCQSWIPEGTIKAAIILVHGYDEHSGRYGYFAEHCTKLGFAVHAVDHWGHGNSNGDNGFVSEFSVYHDGLDALIEQLPETQQSLPMILVGHSLGGLIGATYLLKKQSRFAAAVLSGPAIKATEEPSSFLKALSKILSKAAPKMGVLALDPSGVSRDPKVVADYLADPLVSGTKIGARLAAEMMVNMELVQNQAAKIELPMLMLHGGQDSLTAPEGSEFLHENIGSNEKMLKIYPELFHEIFNEPEKDMVLTDMTDWIARILAHQ
ncbi:monoacylglycerol lipase [Parasphingorhabdus litoris]|uniref:Monoacylglycerol lipase n=1 Tax=Parasphingorhabdus litoris TaxID=394733 RepID=A0ABP3KIZ7_9SPHN|nr:alpha/beta hydrolase [Parasphingorhabdus litoris]